MNRITAIVQSMMASSQEVSYTRRDRLCPPLGARPLGPALCYATPRKMATCMPVMCAVSRQRLVVTNTGGGDAETLIAYLQPITAHRFTKQLTLRSSVVVHAAAVVDSAE